MSIEESDIKKLKLFQFHSDTHFEFYECEKLKKKIKKIIIPNSENCILAGDICMINDIDKMEFILNYCSENFKKTFLISGNHEFYCGEKIKTISELTDDLTNLINKINSRKNGTIQYLNNNYGTITNQNKNEVKIYGTTLWSKVPRRYEDPKCYQMIKDSINDYKCIYIDRNLNNSDKCKDTYIENIKPEDVRGWYEQNFESIKNFLDNEVSEGEKIIIVSHHSPLNKGTSSPRFENEKTRFINLAYANDLYDFIKKYKNKISHWIFGHTHCNCNFEYEGVKIVSNQCGYKLQHGIINYNPSGIE